MSNVRWMFYICSSNVRLQFCLCSSMIIIMDDQLADFIKGAPPGRRVKKLEHSRYANQILQSYYELGWTYRAIAAWLRRKRLPVALSTLHSFIREHPPSSNSDVDPSPATVNEPKPLPPQPIPHPQTPMPTTTHQPSPPTSPPQKSSIRKPRFNLDT